MPSDTGERPRVGLVSDLALVRDALAMQLVRDPHIILVGASTLGAPLPSDADGRGVEVVVLDFGSIGARAWVERMRTAPHCPGLVGIAISKWFVRLVSNAASPAGVPSPPAVVAAARADW